MVVFLLSKPAPPAQAGLTLAKACARITDAGKFLLRRLGGDAMSISEFFEFLEKETEARAMALFPELEYLACGGDSQC